MGLFSKAKEAGKDMVKMYDKVKLSRKMSYEELTRLLEANGLLG